ncbi:MAG: rhamnulokinase family protein [Terriglobales bacterium]
MDLGAESCRVSLLRWIDGCPQIHLIHRFSNDAVEGPAGLTWNLDKILAGMEIGLRACAGIAQEGIAAIGVDGWAVDYVRLDQDGRPLADPFCYRDERNVEAEKQVHRCISPDLLYELTGVQLLRFNTVYQLYADNMRGVLPSAPWVTLPEYVTEWLGGRRAAEYTNATHTQLVTLGQRTWCKQIFDALALDISAAPPLVPPGTIIGKLQGPLSKLPAFSDTRLILPACHDTASAIAGIPATGDDWAFISSGTWSLVGTVLEAPCVNAEARGKNYTNLGGVGGNICFLKNVNGMWLLRQCMNEWERDGKTWAIGDLVAACRNLPAPDALLDVDDPDLLLPGNMPARINAQRLRAGKPALSEASEYAPAMANLIFYSLAARYGDVLKDVSAITGKKLSRLFIVGGGSRNALLNRLTTETTGMEVLSGCVESSTVGNLAIQIAALEGAYSEAKGAHADAVAHWAGILASAYVDASAASAATH